MGEENLILLVHGNSGVFPPQEGMLQGSAVAQLGAGLDVGTIGTQHDADHTLHAVNGLMLGQPADDAAVFAFFHGEVAGHEAGGTMVVGPVELYAAGNPGTQGTD